MARAYLPTSAKIHRKDSIEIGKGHILSTRKNIHSTKVKEPDPDTCKKSNEFYVKIIVLQGKIHTDQTGSFPVQSRRGNKYIIVICDHDSNAMLTRALASKSAAEHLAATQEVHQCLNRRVKHPKMHIMDNECSTLVKECIKYENKIELILVPHYLQRVNAAEKQSISSNVTLSQV